MIAWIVRRFRWVILGWIARTLARLGLKSKIDRSIDQAAADLEDRLPASVVRAADLLPGDLVRSGGVAIAAGQRTKGAAGQARRVAGSTRKVAASTKASTQAVTGARRDVSDRIRSLADEVRVESESARRRLKSDVVRQTEGEGPALEALLDLRDLDEDPIPDVPAPVQPGRRRFRPALPPAPVNRVQRSYRRAVKPWDR